MESSEMTLQNSLNDVGFAVVEQVASERDAYDVITPLGRLMPQYDASLAYEVRVEPGFDDRAFSKSRNGIRAHTEAPGWQIPPRYLALWCHVAARGEGGETCLADVRRYLGGLNEAVVAALRTHAIIWSGTNTSGTGSAGTSAPVLDPDPSGRDVLRYSHNLLTTGSYDPPLSTGLLEKTLPWGDFGAELARKVDHYFMNSAIRIRIPENALLIWDNQRMAHGRLPFVDSRRHLTRFWITDES